MSVATPYPRPAFRTAASAIASVLVVIGLGLPAAPPVDAATCWSPPVDAPVTDPFRAPTCPYCAGHRGIEYGTGAGDPVRAVAAGRVTFAGVVAGTAYVVVEHADGLRVTYGNLERRNVGAGDDVVRGMVIGTTAGRFHLGVRRGDTYLDPAPFIGTWRGIVRLVPADGSLGVASPDRRLVCPGARMPGSAGGSAGTTWSRGFAGRVR